MHLTVDPAILYFGTPVVLVSTLNEDGSPNLAPMSSVWWLGRRCMLGFGSRSKTPQNIRRSGECVLNLPSAELVPQVDRLALTTASDPVPDFKIARGYRHVRDKFALAGLTPAESLTVHPPRVQECPVQLEAKLRQIVPLQQESQSSLVAFEVSIECVHIDPSLLYAGESHRIDPDKWRPLIMSFQQFYGLGPRLHSSTLASIPESAYRSSAAQSAPVVARA